MVSYGLCSLVRCCVLVRQICCSVLVRQSIEAFAKGQTYPIVLGNFDQ